MNNTIEPEKYNSNTDPIFKEKAFFKKKWIFWFGIIATLVSVIASIIAYHKYGSFKYIIWGTIQFLFFVIIISKHPKTTKALKMLSAITLLYLASVYIVEAITLDDKKLVFQQKDLKIVLILIIVYFGGEQLIEVRKIQTNKTQHKKDRG